MNRLAVCREQKQERMGLVPLHSLARWMPRIVSSTADEIVDGVDVLSQDRPKFRRQGRSWRSQSRQHFVMLDLGLFVQKDPIAAAGLP